MGTHGHRGVKVIGNQEGGGGGQEGKDLPNRYNEDYWDDRHTYRPDLGIIKAIHTT